MTSCRRLLTILIGLTVAGLSPWATSYELRTHGEITRKAFEASQGAGRYLELIGISSSDTFALSERTPPQRLDGFDNTGTLQDWMIEGSIREDDYRTGCQPPRNPPSPTDRPLHHFFDVQRGGRGLTVLGFTVGLPGPDWALGEQGQVENGFSLRDARAYQAQSLTAATREERERNAARLFRALGQVVHILEDTAAPQHPRNDPHAGCLEFIAGSQSWYETYIETRAKGERFRSRGQASPPLALDDYGPPQLSIARGFYTGSQGLADFSSRNFLSAGTNFSLFFNFCGGLPEPPCEPAQYARESRSFSIQTLDGTTISGSVTLFTRDVVDPVTGATIPAVPVSTRSVWDEHLETQGPCRPSVSTRSTTMRRPTSSCRARLATRLASLTTSSGGGYP